MAENRNQAAGRSGASRSRQDGKKQSAQKGASSRKASYRKPAKSPYRDEAVLLIILVISVLLLLGIFNLCGDIFGPFISKLLFGSFGMMAYLVPFALFFGTAFYLSNKKNRSAKRKLFSSIGMFLALTGLLELIAGGYDKAASFFSYYSRAAAEKSGGGFLGGALVKILCSVFGKIGAGVILAGVLALLFMLITEKLIFAGLSRHSKKAVEQVRERRRIYEEEREAAAERGEQPGTERRMKFFTFAKEGNETAVEPEKSPGGGEKRKGRKKAAAVPEEKKESTLPVYEEELLHKFSGAKQMPDETAPPADPFLHTTFTFPGAEAIEGKPETPQVENAEWEPAVAVEPDRTEELRIPEKKQEPFPEPAVPKAPEGVTEQPDQAPYNKNDRIDSDRIVSEKAQMAAEVKRNMTTAAGREYRYPPYSLLEKPGKNKQGVSETQLKATALKLQQTLSSFGVHVTITNVSCGPTVTRYELQPEQGVKVSRITGLSDDIKLNLAAADIRIEAPIPGKAAVGIEVPNQENATVMLRELLETPEFKKHPSRIAFAVGKDIGGKTVVTDIGKMPHLLIAGATGSGKSVCINTLIMSILYKARPEEVKLIMIDPKVVELSVYNGIPHLLIPVVTDPKKASAALNWAVAEMMVRYKRFADFGVRDLKGYNEKAKGLSGEEAEANPLMPQIVIIVDELADLMMVAPGEVEEAICRLAQLARAAGLHLIIATQRPSVNVITGVIKANVPSRIAFSVSSAVDSRTILDGAGAEKLLGKGDMLFFPSGIPKPVRVQGAFVSDKEVGSVVEFLTSQSTGEVYDSQVAEKISEAALAEPAVKGASDRDEYFEDAGRFIIEKDKASIGMLQRVYKIGFNRAARIMDQLCEAGVVGPEEGTKPRKVMMTLEEFTQLTGGSPPES